MLRRRVEIAAKPINENLVVGRWCLSHHQAINGTVSIPKMGTLTAYLNNVLPTLDHTYQVSSARIASTGLTHVHS
jgi:hypothetical protein